MRGVNKVIIIGNLGNDPEHKTFQNGGAVTNISVATSEQWTDKQTGEKKEATEWHRISLYDRGNYRLADIAAKYLRKGSQVYIEGSLHTRKWQDQNGQDRYTTEIRAESMQMLGSAGAGGQMGGGYNQGSNQNNNQAGSGGYANQDDYQASNNQQPSYNNQGSTQGGGQNNNASNQNSFAQNSGSNNNSFGKTPSAPQKNEFNNQTSSAPMADTPTDDDIPF